MNMPLVLTEGQIGTLKNVKDANPTSEVSLLLSTSAVASFALNYQNGCNHYLSFLFSNNVCKIRYDGKLKPRGVNFGLQIEKQGEVTLPIGCTSWLDLWESSSPGEMGKKVDLSLYDFVYRNGVSGVSGITILNLPIHDRKYYVLRTRSD